MLSSTSSGASSLVARTFSNRILAALGGFACLFLLIGVLPISTVRPAFALALHPTATQDNAQLLSAVIAGLQRKYSRMQSIAADFSQSYIGSDGRSFVERGRLILKRPGKARWDYVEPEKKIFISDGRNIYFYVIGDREALRSSIRESTDPQIPFLFLLGRGDLRRDFSRIEIAGEAAIRRNDLVLLLVPRKAPEEFRQLLAEVDPESFTVIRLVIFQRNGTRMSFVLSNMRENPSVTNDEFKFNPPAGVKIRPAI
ncbi:MAG: outer membrane lipoprotein carrier protein LolA [Blastocatellia bacterium AA13]|nr:MAG: outer membrane lipoprotein carrier protein LolA [Blastocatellia bacterium AA13]